MRINYGILMAGALALATACGAGQRTEDKLPARQITESDLMEREGFLWNACTPMPFRCNCDATYFPADKKEEYQECLKGAGTSPDGSINYTKLDKCLGANGAFEIHYVLDEKDNVLEFTDTWQEARDSAIRGSNAETLARGWK